MTDLTSSSPYSTHTPPTNPISEGWDQVMAASSIFCFVIGTIGNILALIYFANKRKDLPTKIYILMTITDTLSCMLVIAVGQSFLNGRRPGWFEKSWFCDIWSTSWNVIPYFSVFLVLVLSVVRTVSLVRPFGTVSHKLVLAIISVYLVYLVARVVVPDVLRILNNSTHITHVYDAKYLQQVYCAIRVSEKGALWDYQIASNVIQLTVPVIPIIVSCVISCYCVLKSRKTNALSRKAAVQKSLAIPKVSMSHQTSESSDVSTGEGAWNKMKRTARNLSTVSMMSSRSSRNTSTVSSVGGPGGKDRQIQATITILLITATYILFNIPVFIYYLFFTVEIVLIKNRNKWVFLTDNHVNYYGWNLVFVQCVALNAALNPILYCWRIGKLRQFYSRDRIRMWWKVCVDNIMICLGLKDKCYANQRTSFSVTHSRTYVEVIQEEVL
ncbi:hypothetical protein ACHWQZ_G009813 [Mnemiopsis leidyi]